MIMIVCVFVLEGDDAFLLGFEILRRERCRVREEKEENHYWRGKVSESWYQKVLHNALEPFLFHVSFSYSLLVLPSLAFFNTMVQARKH